MSALAYSVVFFAAAAMGGLVLANAHIKKLQFPRLLVIGHPLMAATGLVLLGTSYVRADGPRILGVALLILLGAAAGGIGLATLRVRIGRAPPVLVVAHALVALCGVGVILYALFAGDAAAVAPITALR